jgi:hypothetical protein
MPPKLDKEVTIIALRDVRHEWDMKAIWRTTNLSEHDFIYSAKTQTGHI